MLQQAYGEDCLGRTQFHELYQRFKTGRTSIEDDPRSGRPSTSIDDDRVEKVLAVICQNRLLTVREVAEVGICKGSCHQMFTDKLKMRRVASKSVPRLMTDAQKENRITASQGLFDRLNADENFLKNVITGDETWAYGYDVATKVQSSQWMGKLSPRPKKARQSRSNVRVTLAVFFFDWKVIVRYEFVPCGETVDIEFYLNVLKRLRETVRRKRPEAWTNNIWMLHHDNAPAHASLLIREF